MFQELGLQEKTLEKAVAHVGNSDATLMAFMKVVWPLYTQLHAMRLLWYQARFLNHTRCSQAFEFGCNDEDLTRSPYRAGATAGGLFSFGALPAVLTFGLLDRTNALIFGSLACCLVLFMVGACKTKLTRTNPIWAGLENMMCGASGAACNALCPRTPSPCSVSSCSCAIVSCACSVFRGRAHIRQVLSWY